MRTFALLFAVSVSFIAGEAWAGCTTDMDCKGDRICEDGVCTSPPGGSVAPGPTTTPKASETRYEKSSTGGGVLGIVGGTFVLLLGSGSVAAYYNEDFEEDDINYVSLGLGSLGTLGGLIMLPIAGTIVGSRTDRVGAVVTGWVTYGLFGINALALVGIGAGGGDPGAAPIAGATALGLVSGLAFGIGGLLGPRDSGETATLTLPRVMPTTGVAVLQRGKTQPTMGLAFSF